MSSKIPARADDELLCLVCHWTGTVPHVPPLTDSELDAMAVGARQGQTSDRLVTWVPRLVAEIREARRLLRAVEWSPDCPLCEVMDGGGHTPTCELGRHLGACDGDSAR